jgi:hypothetical protein
MKEQKTTYLVGHYIDKIFKPDSIHDDLKDAMKNWERICKETYGVTSVEIRKQTYSSGQTSTEVVVERIFKDPDQKFPDEIFESVESSLTGFVNSELEHYNNNL